MYETQSVKVMQPITIDNGEVIDKAEIQHLTPTEQIIRIEREAIPKLKGYQQQIQSLCDRIEQGKSQESQLIESEVKAQYESAAHPHMTRVELDYMPSIQHIATDKMLSFVTEGYVIARKKIITDRYLILCMVKPGYSPEDIMNDLKGSASEIVKRQIDQAEKELAAVRAKLTAFKKSVQVALAEVPTLAELMKQVR